MPTFLARAATYIPLLPPLGDLPPEFAAGKVVESFSWENPDTQDEITLIFPKPIKVTDKVSDADLPGAFHYDAEVKVEADSLEEAAERSVFILEQVLDTASLFSQAACRVLSFRSIVNFSQIEEALAGRRDSFEQGRFRAQRLTETKALPPGRMLFLSETGIKWKGRNIYWFRKGLADFSSMYRFVSFFTALNELDGYFREASKAGSNYRESLHDFLTNDLNLPTARKEWGDIRNDIIHFSGRRRDFRSINRAARLNLPALYRATYYGIMKFFTDTPPEPSALILYDEIAKETVAVTPEVSAQLKSIHQFRAAATQFSIQGGGPKGV